MQIPATNFLTTTWDYLDYAPLLSTGKSLIELFLKYVIVPRLDKEKIARSHIYTDIMNKHIVRILTTSVPVLGNIMIALYDYAMRKWNDKTYVLSLLSEDEKAIQSATEQLQHNREFVLEALERKAAVYLYIKPYLRNDPRFVEDALRKNGAVLKHLDQSQKDNIELVKIAVQGKPWLLNGVSERLQIDTEVIRAAYQGPVDRAKVLFALQSKPSRLEYLVGAQGNERSFVHQFLAANGELLKYFPAYTNDKEIVVAAVRNYPLAIEDANSDLKDDRDVVEAAMVKDPIALKYASARLQNDPALKAKLENHRGT